MLARKGQENVNGGHTFPVGVRLDGFEALHQGLIVVVNVGFQTYVLVFESVIGVDKNRQGHNHLETSGRR